jgi:hypothetical protein
VSIQIAQFDLDSLRARIREMNDAELLRFGQAARFLCSPGQNSGRQPREKFVIQLKKEARAEWRRRFPKLPLKASM